MSALSLALLSLLVCCAWSDVLYYNNAADCSSGAGCSITDPTIWEGGKAPTNDDAIIVKANSTVTLVMDGGVLALANVTISGSVTFYLTNGAHLNITDDEDVFITSSFTMDSSTTLIMDSLSSLSAGGISAGFINTSTAHISAGFVSAKKSTILATYTNFDVETYIWAGTISMSNCVMGDVNVVADYLYTYGSLKFWAPPTIHAFASFNQNPILDFGNVSAFRMENNTRLEFHDCIAKIDTLFMVGYNTSLCVTTTDPLYSLTIFYLDVITTAPTIELGDNVQFTMYNGWAPIIASKGAVLNFPNRDNNFASILVTQPAASSGTFWIGTYLALSILTGSDLSNAIVAVSSTGSLTINDPQHIGMVADSENCALTGDGQLILYSTLYCSGSVNIGSVIFQNGSLATTSLTTRSIQVQNPAAVNGSVQIGSVPAIPECQQCALVGSSSFSAPLYVGGSFTQKGGNFTAIFTASLPSAFLLTNGNIFISDANLTISTGVSFPTGSSGSFQLATSGSGTVNVTFSSMVDLANKNNKLKVSQNGGDLTILVNPKIEENKNFLHKYLVALVCGGAGLILVIAIGIYVGCKRNRRTHYQPV